MKRIRLKKVNGSMTVEMSLLMPIILFLILSCILAVFYFHDKNIIAAAAYETSVVGSTKMREAEGVDEGELTALFAEREMYFIRRKQCQYINRGKADISRSYRRKRKIPSVCAKESFGDGA